jgi:hypothetical protein
MQNIQCNATKLMCSATYSIIDAACAFIATAQCITQCADADDARKFVDDTDNVTNDTDVFSVQQYIVYTNDITNDIKYVIDLQHNKVHRNVTL